MLVALLVFVALLAYANGANDNFKGVASLYGSRSTSYRTAIWWATATTFAGSICSILLARSLLLRFSGRGLVPDAVAGSEPFLLSVAVGSGLTVIAATKAGLPISTTHALIGAMVGTGIFASEQVNWSALMQQFFAPLLFSPLVAVVLGAGTYAVLHGMRLRLGIGLDSCVCVGNEIAPMPVLAGHAATVAEAAPALTVTTGTLTTCSQTSPGRLIGVDVQRGMDVAHLVSAGLLSFARGLNDTPKIAALLMATSATGVGGDLATVGMAIALGGLLNGRRVAETMSHRITDMNHGQALSANLVTGVLVIAATRFGLPVSTTHASVGALSGIGLVTGQARIGVISGIALSWLFTLPCAAGMSAIIFMMVSMF